MKTLLPAVLLLAACASTEAPAPEPAPTEPPPHEEEPREKTPPLPTPPRPATWQAVIHAPGPGWVEGTSPFEQPHIDAHVEHYRALLEDGRLAVGGPYLDGPGGMMLLQDVSREEAEELAAADPAVVAGTLTFEVRSWLTAMTSLGP